MPFDSKRPLTTPSDAESVDVEGLEDSDGRRGIRCPLCRWQPDRSCKWQCGDAGPPENFQGGCGTVWNTFETSGKCPGCGHQWRFTSCFACLQWSPHEAWYFEE
jgi:hypothetical protein